MSFFNSSTKSSESSTWGGLLKQAGSLASTVGKGLDKVLDIQATDSNGDGVDIDPITGMVVTTDRSTTAPKPAMKPAIQPAMVYQRSTAETIGPNSASSSRPGTPTSNISERPSSVNDKSKRTGDLASRLNAIMQEKAGTGSGKSDTDVDEEKDDSMARDKEDIEKEQGNEDIADTSIITEQQPEKKDAEPLAEDIGILDSESNKSVDNIENSNSKEISSTKRLSSSTPRSSLDTTDPASFNLIIAQRERQLMNAMKENAQLNEAAEDLRAQLNKLSTELSAAQQRIQEFDSQTQSLTSESRTPIPSGPLQKTVEELRTQLKTKDEQITGLMEEGEKLSKNELKHLTTIKKLRTEKTEKEKELLELQKKFDKVMGEQGEKDGKVMKASEGEKRANETVKALQDLTQTQTKQLTKVETELVAAKEEKTTLSAALEKAYEELAEAKNKLTEATSLQQSQALEKEIKANEAMHKELEQVRRDAEETEERLRKEVRELQLTLSQLREHVGEREDQLRKDILNLQISLQAAEAKNEDFTAGLDDSTQPLLRQIEALQTQYSTALKSWEITEKRLTEGLRDTEAERTNLLAKEKSLSAKLVETMERISDLELQLSTERHTTSRLSTELETERLRYTEAEIRLNQVTTKLENLRATQTRAIDEVKENYQRLLRQQLQEERDQLEQRQRQEEEARAEREKETERKRSRGFDSRRARLEIEIANGSVPSPLARSSSYGSFDAQSPTSSSRSSFDSTTNSISAPANLSTTVMMERLNSTVKQMEGQISFLQVQLQATQQSRDEMAEELMKMTVQLEELKGQAARAIDLEKEQENLNQRYHASLELLGERTELVNELKADLADVKEMYRTQISDLMDRLNEPQKRDI